MIRMVAANIGLDPGLAVVGLKRLEEPMRVSKLINFAADILEGFPIPVSAVLELNALS